MSKIVYQLKNINKKYNKSENNAFALKDINLVLEDNGLVAITGVSGSGKTTLLNILGGMDKASSGEVFYNGLDISKISEKERDGIRNTDFSFAFQNFNLIKDYTVYDNVALGLEFQGKKSHDINKKVTDTLNSVGLSGFEKRKINSLSGGQVERVSIARALAKDSKVLLCDEPTANLDPIISKEIFNLLKSISDRMLVIVVTHNINLAKEYSDRFIALKDGTIIEDTFDSKIIEEKKSKEIKYKPAKLNIKSVFQAVLGNIKNTKLMSFISLAILSVLLAVFITLLSLSNYTSVSSYTNTFKENDQYLINVTKYLENNARKEDKTKEEGYSYVGAQLNYEQLDESDIIKLKEKINNKCEVYPEYFYNTSLLNYNKNYKAKIEGNFYSKGFKNIIAVDNFNNFYQPLKSGKLPTNKNEILIYDYIATSLINSNVLEGDLIGQKPIDYVNGNEFIISGILKSSYERYNYLENKKITSLDDYALSYLNELETIICFKTKYQELKISNNYCFGKLIASLNITSSDQNNTIELPSHVNIGEYNLSTDFSYDYVYEGILNTASGYVISKKTAMTIAGINNITEFDNASFGTEYKGSEAFCEAYSLYGFYEQYDKQILPSYFGSTIFTEILGITDDTSNTSISYVNGYFNGYDDLSFRCLSLSLTNNWNTNKEVISKNIWPKMQDNAYYEKLTEGNEIIDYSIYTSLSGLISDSKDYIPTVMSTAKNICIYVSILTVLILFYFAYSSIKNNFYKIGIYKSLGMTNLKMTFIFGLSMLINLVLSFILAIPLGYLLMNKINSDFIIDLGKNLMILNVEPISFIFAALIGLGVLIIGSAYPLIDLFRLSPNQMIKNNE